MSLVRLRQKIRRHPVLGKAQRWAWVAPGNVPDPIVLGVTAARVAGAELILKLSRRNEKLGRALVRKHASKRQKIRIVTGYSAFKKFAAHADAWVVYGSDATIEAMRKIAPKSAGFVAYGHRISMSVVFRSALTQNFKCIVDGCVADIRTYDQAGCLSPQIIWVEGDAEPFARALQEGLLRSARSGGSMRRDPENARIRAAVVGELTVRALNSSELELMAPPSGPLVYRLKRGKFLSPAVGQVIAVKSFKSISDIHRGMKNFSSRLQGIAFAGTAADRTRFQNAFKGSSAVYFPSIGDLQRPPLDWQL